MKTKSTSKSFSVQDVDHIAKLANIPVSDEEKKVLADGFSKTIAVVDKLFKVDVSGIDPTHHVTGLENVFRDDTVDEKRMFSQDQALANAKRSYNGYFVVNQVLDQEG